MKNLEKALSGTHEIRIIVNADEFEDLMDWNKVIAELRKNKTCVYISMYPVQPHTSNYEMTFPENGALGTETIELKTEKIF